MARYIKQNVNSVPSINAELTKIQTAIQDTLSRKGDVPNQMEGTLDMNSERIINLPEPVSDHEPFRKGDLPIIEATLQPYVDEATAQANRSEQEANRAENEADRAFAEADRIDSLVQDAVNSAAGANYVGEEPPAEFLVQGVRWYKPSESTTYVYYCDGDSCQWVQEPVQSAEGTLRQELASVDSSVSVGGVEAGEIGKRFDEWVHVTKYPSFKGDGVNDDLPAFISAKDECLATGKGLYCPPSYRITLSAGIDLSGIRNIKIESDITIPSGTIITGGNLNKGISFISFQTVTNGTNVITAPPPANPVVRVSGIANSEFSIGNCNYLQLYAIAGDAANRLVAYSKFNLFGATSLLEITDSGGSLGYVNENNIYAHRIIRYRVLGVGYPHNHNKLHHPTMEGSTVEITFSGGAHVNQVYGARFENVASSPGVTFSANSFSNTVTSTWSGVGNPWPQFINLIPINDLGAGNMVTTESAFQFDKTNLFSVGINSQLLSTSNYTSAPDPRICPANAGVNNFVNKAVLVPSLKGFRVPDTFRFIALTEPIPVRLGDVITFDADFDGSLLRTVIFVLDENLKPLTDNSGGEFISQPAVVFNATFGSYSNSSNASALNARQNSAAIIRSEVKFVRVGVAAGVAGFIRHVGANIYTQTIGRGNTEGGGNKFTLRSINGTPTRGYVPLDTIIYDHVNSLIKRCSFQYETGLATALAEGDTSVTVSTISTVANGDVVGILLDNEETHWSAVSGLSGSTFTISAIPEGRFAAAGSRVVFNRWL